MPRHDLSGKSLIIFDLDGTLAESKASIDAEMAELLGKLLEIRRVAVIGGGAYALFKKNFTEKLLESAPFQNLSLFPTTGTSFYAYDGKEWKEVYRETLSSPEREGIQNAFKQALKELNYAEPKTYGEIIEDRGSQITFSALGQEAPLEEKKAWVARNAGLKMEIAKRVGELLPQFEVRAAGYTSIDVTKKGIDKAYGIHKMEEYLKVPLGEMLFLGDALFEGGNDYAVLKTGIEAIPVKGPAETKEIIREIMQGELDKP